jgi:hypothetical protein
MTDGTETGYARLETRGSHLGSGTGHRLELTIVAHRGGANQQPHQRHGQAGRTLSRGAGPKGVGQAMPGVGAVGR